MLCIAMSDPGIESDNGRAADAAASGGRRPLRLVARTAVKSWHDGIFGMSAQAAFWQTLSMPPLLLGLLGSLGYVSGWFGPATVQEVESKVISFCRTVFSPSVVEQIIAPSVRDILSEGRPEIISIGFLISLFAGSSAMACFVDSITQAYRQRDIRNAVWQRLFALLLYLVALVIGVFTLPVLALGPNVISELAPNRWTDTVSHIVDRFYYPGVGFLLLLALATLYKVALPRKLPWHRGLPGALLAMVVFLATSSGLRLYITWLGGTGYTFGALATPIAFLLFSFFIAFAIVLGAQLNNAIEETWPAHMTQRERRRWRRLEMDRAAERMRAEGGRDAWVRRSPDGRVPARDRQSPPPAGIVS